MLSSCYVYELEPKGNFINQIRRKFFILLDGMLPGMAHITPSITAVGDYKAGLHILTSKCSPIYLTVYSLFAYLLPIIRLFQVDFGPTL